MNQNNLTIQLGEKLFSFTSKIDWVNKAQSRFRNCPVREGNYICIDSAGRVCQKGKEFTRAEDEGTYPITVYKTMLDT